MKGGGGNSRGREEALTRKRLTPKTEASRYASRACAGNWGEEDTPKEAFGAESSGVISQLLGSARQKERIQGIHVAEEGFRENGKGGVQWQTSGWVNRSPAGAVFEEGEGHLDPT